MSTTEQLVAMVRAGFDAGINKNAHSFPLDSWPTPEQQAAVVQALGQHNFRAGFDAARMELVVVI
jgi:hypothetical protein